MQQPSPVSPLAEHNSCKTLFLWSAASADEGKDDQPVMTDRRGSMGLNKAAAEYFAGVGHAV
jgi:hypothetical protein